MRYLPEPLIHPVSCLTFDEQGQNLLIGGRNCLIRWNIIENTRTDLYGWNTGLVNTSFVGNAMVLATMEGDLFWMDHEGRRLNHTRSWVWPIANVVVDPIHKQIVMSGRRNSRSALESRSWGNLETLWQWNEPSNTAHLVNILHQHGDTLYVSGSDTISLHRIATGELLTRWTLGHGNCMNMTVSPDARWVIAGRDTQIAVFDQRSGILQRQLLGNSSNPVSTLICHPYRPWLWSIQGDSLIRQWDMESWVPMPSYGWDNVRVNQMAISPDGTVAAAAYVNGKVIVWDLDV